MDIDVALHFTWPLLLPCCPKTYPIPRMPNLQIVERGPGEIEDIQDEWTSWLIPIHFLYIYYIYIYYI